MAATIRVAVLLLVAAVAFVALAAHGEEKVRYANLFRRYEALQEKRNGLTNFASNMISQSSAETLFFTQKLDHFNAQDQRTWKQRYYVNFDQVDSMAEPAALFVYIGGEGELSSRSIESGEIVENAAKYNAAMIGVEHRYYGQSQPFESWTTENLRFLSSQQALADLANLLTTVAQQYGWTNIGDRTIVVGGSYPGSLSAWFRLKYPHLATGSLASSAPVLALAEFWQYDATCGNSLGESCASLVRQATDAIEQELAKDGKALKESFGCGTVADDVDFLYALADSVAFAVQYNSETPGPTYHLKDKLCQELTDAGKDLVSGYRNFFKDLLESTLRETCTGFTQTAETIGNTTVTPQGNLRQWYYQSCTEFGYFQTAPRPEVSGSILPLRSKRIDLQYHKDLCRKAFGVPLEPAVDFINAYYGGNETFHGSKVVFPNGLIDPWHTLSVQSSIPHTWKVEPLLIEGTAHCADLHSSSEDDPPQLTAARERMTTMFGDWLSHKTSASDTSPPTIDGHHAAPRRQPLLTGVLVLVACVAIVLAAAAMVLVLRKLRARRATADAQAITDQLIEATA